MNVNVTSKETIMQVCRSIVSTKGLQSLNMRSVANECHIALGTLYNYYSNKNDLLLATIESVWHDIFHTNQCYEKATSFPEYVNDIFDCIQKGTQTYPNFFTAHSISIAKSQKGEAQNIMEHYFEHMKKGMLEVLHKDRDLSDAAFSSILTESDFIDFVLDYIIILLIRGASDCDVLIEMIQRIIYK